MQAKLTTADGKTYEAANLSTTGTGKSILNLDGVIHNADFTNTNPPPAPAPAPDTAITYQAESARLIGNSRISNDNAGFTGAGYVDFGAKGSGIEHTTIMRQQSGDAVIEVRYAAGSTNRPCDIIVNGANKGSLKFDQSSGVKDWKVEKFTTGLRQGANTVRIVCTTDNGGPNIDIITVSTVSAPPPLPPTIPTSPTTGLLDYGNPAADLAAFSSRPKSFPDKAAALKWDRDFFGKLTGHRVPDASLEVLTSIKLVDGTAMKPNIVRNKHIKNDVDFSNRKYVWLVDCKIDGDNGQGGYAVHTKNGPATGCKVLHSTIVSAGSAMAYVRGVKDAPFEIAWCDINEGEADAIKAVEFVRLWGNWWYGLGKSEGSHADGVQLQPGWHDVYCGLFFSDMPNDADGHSNATAMLDSTSYNVTFEHGVVLGGNYVFQAHAKNVNIDDLRYYGGSARFGLVTGSNADDKITNITDAVTGQAV